MNDKNIDSQQESNHRESLSS